MKLALWVGYLLVAIASLKQDRKGLMVEFLISCFILSSYATENSVQCTSVQLVALPILKEGDTHLVVFDFFVSIHFQRNYTLSSSYATKLAQ